MLARTIYITQKWSLTSTNCSSLCTPRTQWFRDLTIIVAAILTCNMALSSKRRGTSILVFLPIRHWTSAGTSHPLPRLFWTIAIWSTQNGSRWDNTECVRLVQRTGQSGIFGLHWRYDYAASIMDINSIWQDDPILIQVLETARYYVGFPLIVFHLEISAIFFFDFSISDSTAWGNFYQMAIGLLVSIVVSREGGHSQFLWVYDFPRAM